MKRYKCQACGKNQYSSDEKAEKAHCIHCGHQGTELQPDMDDHEEEERYHAGLIDPTTPAY